MKGGRCYLAQAVREQQDSQDETHTKTQTGATAISAGALGSIVGVAVNADGKGVEDVAVSVYREEDAAEAVATATTEANGKFTFEKVPAGDDFVVRAALKKSLFGICGQKEHVVVQAGRTRNVGKIELKVPMSSRAKMKPAPDDDLKQDRQVKTIEPGGVTPGELLQRGAWPTEKERRICWLPAFLKMG